MPHTAGGQPLHFHTVVDTRNPEAMRDAMLTRYGATSFDVLSDRQCFVGRGNYVPLADVGLGFCAYSSESVAEFPEADYARLQIGTLGRASTDTAGASVDIDAAQWCVSSPGRSSRLRFGANYRQMVMRIERHALEQKLAGVLGMRPKAGLVFEPALAATTPGAQALLSLLQFCCDQINAPASLPPLLARELAQTVIVAFLCATRHNFSHLLEADAGTAAPHHVRRAEEFIAANWQRAIAIEELTALTGVSARTLARSFMAHRGCSPRMFVKQVRLREARAMLQAGDAAATVTAIAFACNFGNLGHFARDYCEAFGELPSATLAHAQRMMA